MKATIQIDKNAVISPVDKRIYGSFIEHLGRAVYGGIYEPGSRYADSMGFRKDVLDAVKKLNVPIVRYPGGNFVSGYNWEDGVGDKSKRPRRLELAWTATETNEFGLDEFQEWARLADTEVMLAVNLGTRGPEQARDLIEYCNFPGGTKYSDMRRANGFEKPFGIKTWCLGNEMDGPWQMCAKTADEYGRTACETAKMMKWVDDGIELVACGSSNMFLPTFGSWERTVLEHTYKYVDYISLHAYYNKPGGDTPAFLAQSVLFDRFIKTVAGICDEVGARKGIDKKVNLSLDEWNVWQSAIPGREPEFEKWSVAPARLEDVYTFEDALVVGCLMLTMLKNADRVKMACLAQLVNVIAPIMTANGGGMYLQTIFYPFMYTSNYGRGLSLVAQPDCPEYSVEGVGSVPYLETAAVYNEQAGEVVLFAVNRAGEAAQTEVSLGGFEIEGIAEQVVYDCADLSAVNSFDAPDNAVPRAGTSARTEGDKVAASLPPLSWNMIRIKVK